MRYAIVTTTINMPHLIDDYAADCVAHDRDVFFVIAGDRKTPASVGGFCADVQRKHGVAVIYMDGAEQEAYLQRFPELAKHIPWNCIQRRNVAILKAYEMGADIIALIDDDNYLADQDFCGGHSIVGSSAQHKVYGAGLPWFNVCGFLEERSGRRFFPRGFSLTERRAVESNANPVDWHGKVVVNAGLWLGDPDIDAITRLAIAPDVTAYSLDHNFVLHKGTWCPFNSQNTALAREVVPAYFLSPHIGRFDDIWAAYVIKAIADHLGHGIAFGRPLVQQRRNEHDLWSDLDLERFGLSQTDRFCGWLSEVTLHGDTYGRCLEEMIPQLQSAVLASSLASGPVLNAYVKMLEGYMVWTATMRRVAG